MKSFTQALLLVICLYKFNFPQNPDWYYVPTSTNQIYSMAFEGDYVWACKEGLAKINIDSREQTYYHISNSPLPSMSCELITIDGSGNKWIGTNSGLVKFDGTNWTTYNKSNSDLLENYFKCITAEASGTIWIGTFSGMYKFDGSEWTHYFSSNSPINDFVPSIAIDGSGNKWIASNGLKKFDGQNWTDYNKSNSGLPVNNVREVAVDGSDNIWAATSGGLAKFDGSNWTVYNTSILPSNDIRSVKADGFGNIWIVLGFGGGIGRFDGINWRFYNTANSTLLDNFVISLAVDKSGYVWAGTNSCGMAKFDGTNWVLFDVWNPGPPGVDIQSIIKAENGDMWIGTRGGLGRFDGFNWKNYAPANSGLSGYIVHSIVSYGDTLLIGTDRGLSKFDGVTWNTIFSPEVRDIAIDSKGNIWCNSYGIHKFDGTKWIDLPPYNSIRFHTTCLAIDKENNLWFGSDDDLVKYDGQNYNVYNLSNFGVTATQVSKLAIDSKGYIWIGTSSGSLLKFDGTNCIVYNNANSGSSNDEITSIYIDESDTKWIGTYKKGVVKFDGINWTVYNESNSPISNTYIPSIAVDKRGNTWIGTSKGIVLFRQGGVVSADENNLKEIPEDFILYQNYPNPFNPSTKIKYTIPNSEKMNTSSSLVTLKVFDILGREVATLVNEEKQPGNYEVNFNSSSLTSGAYFYNLTVNGHSTVKKMMILK